MRRRRPLGRVSDDTLGPTKDRHRGLGGNYLLGRTPTSLADGSVTQQCAVHVWKLIRQLSSRRRHAKMSPRRRARISYVFLLLHRVRGIATSYLSVRSSVRSLISQKQQGPRELHQCLC